MATTETDPGPVPHDRAHEDPLAEIRKVRDTAERMANGDHPAEADQTRVLAGMIHQLAEQVERLADPAGGGRPQTQTQDAPSTAVAPGTNPPQRVDHDREAADEEDLTPEVAPAEPADDRADS